MLLIQSFVIIKLEILFSSKSSIWLRKEHDRHDAYDAFKKASYIIDKMLKVHSAKCFLLEVKIAVIKLEVYASPNTIQCRHRWLAYHLIHVVKVLNSPKVSLVERNFGLLHKSFVLMVDNS